jgi:hypothetical protein
VPDQDAGFGLVQLPALRLLAAMVVPAQRSVDALAIAAVTWNFMRPGKLTAGARSRHRSCSGPWLCAVSGDVINM